MNTTIGNVRAKAQPDECFSEVGMNVPFTKPPCLFGQPKVNQSYVWAMTEAGNEIWFGTAANPQCITEAALFPSLSVPYRAPSWACEFDKSPYVSQLGTMGDFRPPRLFVYNTITRTTTEVTPTQPVTAQNPLGLDPLLYQTVGIRAAVTTLDGYVVFGGQALSTTPLINFFVFKASDHSYIGTSTVAGYDTIRQFAVKDGQVYTAVGKGADQGGAVLRYTGANGTVEFEEIGTLDGPGAYIAAHGDRLFVTTWPTGTGSNIAGLFMSPPLPQEGFTAPTVFTKVWDASAYEPDPAATASYGIGALASFDGFLYWGTMHVPWAATNVFASVYGTPEAIEDRNAAVIGTFRAATIFRGFHNPSFDTPDVELLYGSPVLWAFIPPSGDRPGGWNLVPNNMPPGRKTPLFGAPGLWNPYNNYTWSMTVWDNRLWIGMMDWSYSAQQATQAVYNGVPQTVPVDVTSLFDTSEFGADLFFFQSSQTPAVPENRSGLGNFSTYGVRNMVSSNNLFLGMANPANLLTSEGGTKGGWELIELQRNPQVGPLTLLNGFSCAPAVITGAGKVTCTASANASAGPAGSTVGMNSILPLGVSAAVPPSFNIAPGQNQATVEIAVSDVAKPTDLLLVAALNGGTRIAPVTVNPGTPRIESAVTGKGVERPGTLWLDVTHTNTGNGNAEPLMLTSHSFQTLSGTGTVTVADSTPPLPFNAGSIAPGTSKTVRIYLSVPATVKAFSMTESGTVKSLAGTTFDISNRQVILTTLTKTKPSATRTTKPSATSRW